MFRRYFYMLILLFQSSLLLVMAGWGYFGDVESISFGGLKQLASQPYETAVIGLLLFAPAVMLPFVTYRKPFENNTLSGYYLAIGLVCAAFFKASTAIIPIMASNVLKETKKDKSESD